MSSDSGPGPRDLMYCHQCENEWYRDEHGLACPECGSDFTEVIEDGHDPRDEEPPVLDHHTQDHDPGDPDEEDIEDVRWRRGEGDAEPGQPLPNTFHRSITFGGGQPSAPQGLGGGLMGIVGSLFQNSLPQVQQQQHDHQSDGQLLTPGRPRGRTVGGTTVRHFGGPGYSMTITSASSTTGSLFPRNANQPQAFQGQPEHIDQMLEQMMMNIGAFADGRVQVGAVPGGPGGDDRQGPIGMEHILHMLGGGRGGIFGDAVFSDEALDQVMTRLMEQHQAGNAPGPATTDAITALPTKQIGKEDLDESGKADCSICMDEVNIGDTVTALPCKHWFHFDCVKAWLTEHDTCPHCRQGIMPRESDNQADPRSPDQPPLNDTSSPQAARPASSSGGGMFARMRNTFSSSHSSNHGGNGNS